MKLEKALVTFFAYYEAAKANPAIRDKVAWSLYQTWRDADREGHRNTSVEI